MLNEIGLIVLSCNVMFFFSFYIYHFSEGLSGYVNKSI